MPLNTWRTQRRLPARKIRDFPWAAGLASGSADVQLCWREVFLNNYPEIIVNFPEGHDLVFYLNSLIVSHENTMDSSPSMRIRLFQEDVRLSKYPKHLI